MTPADQGSDWPGTDSLRHLIPNVIVDLVQMREFERRPLILTRGSGIRVWDADGRAYLDAVSGVFVVGVGHGNRRVIEAMRHQLDRIAFAAPTLATNDRMLELAGRLVELTPPEIRVVKFHSGGSEAIEAAIKMARQYHRQTGSPGRYKIISRHRSYHGATLGALAATGFPQFRAAFEPLPPGFVHIPQPHPAGCALGPGCPPCTLACADILDTVITEEGSDTVAAVILEPVANMAGMLAPPAGYLDRVREICDRHGVLLIYDEIVTGMGRLGSWFGAEHFGVWPDLLCLGKGVTSGYAPLSAVLMHHRIADAFRGERRDMVHLQHGHTYGGNPLACAAAIAVLDEIAERGLLENAKAAGQRLHDGLEGLAARHPAIRNVRSIGLLVAFDLAATQPALARATEEMGKQPMLVFGPGPTGTVRFAPPLIIEPDEIGEILGMVDNALTAARLDGDQEGATAGAEGA